MAMLLIDGEDRRLVLEFAVLTSWGISVGRSRPSPSTREMDSSHDQLDNYCSRIRQSILQYCHHFPQKIGDIPSTGKSSQSPIPTPSSSSEDAIISILVGESYEWCKYEAFCYGFEEILYHEKLYSEQQSRYEELKQKYEDLQQKNDEHLREIQRLKHLLSTSETSSKQTKNQKKSPFHPLTNATNQENRRRFPAINLHEI